MDGKPGETNQGNTELVEYGIQTEESDIRVHVCPVVRRVYVFPTECGIEAANSGNYRLVEGYQEGVEVPTAQGYLVPPMDIRCCASITLREEAWAYMSFTDNDDLRIKGDKAERLVKGMLKSGLLPVPLNGERITDSDIQKQGKDILVVKGRALDKEDIRIQVKCDYPGGDKHLGGTGNLFLQISECNPNRIY